MDDCIFCKIVAGDIPSTKVYEDETALAFEDVNPLMPVHTLIIPKKHYDDISGGIPDSDLGHLFNTAVKVAGIKGIAERGFRIIVNTGTDAQQSVHHLHIHLFGGEKMNIGSPKAAK